MDTWNGPKGDRIKEVLLFCMQVFFCTCACCIHLHACYATIGMWCLMNTHRCKVVSHLPRYQHTSQVCSTTIMRSMWWGQHQLLGQMNPVEAGLQVCSTTIITWWGQHHFLGHADEPVGEYTSHHTTQGASQPSRYYIIPRNALFLIKAVHPYEL